MKVMTYEELVKTHLDADDRFEFSKLEEKLGFRHWQEYMPFISFPQEWEIQVIPPFSGALSRFRVRLKDCHDSYVSVYFDPYNHLGAISWDEYMPYWEVYPAEDGEPGRCQMNEVDELLEIIRRGLAARRKDIEQ